MRFAFIFVLLLVATVVHAQTVFGIVRDSSDNQPVPFCNILIKGTMKGTTTAADGSFRLSVDALPVTLVFRFAGYRAEEVVVSDANKPVSVILHPVTHYLKEVVIGENLPVCIQSDKAVMAADFEFYDNYILLLTYPDVKTALLTLSDENGNPIRTLPVSGKAQNLYRDAFGKVHVQSADSSWQVYYDYEKLQLLDAVSMMNFEWQLYPSKLYTAGRLYFQLYHYHDQRCVYTTAVNGKMTYFHYACDTNGVQYIQRKYDIRYFLDKRKRGEGYQTSVRYIKSHLQMYQEQIFPDVEDKTFLHALNAPLVLHDNAVWIFQFADNIAIRFDEKQNPVDTVPLTFHHEQGWQGNILRDEITDDLYTLYVVDGITQIILLDPVTLREKSRSTIDNFPFIRKLLIRNGVAYFLWRNTDGEGSNRLLYRYVL
jgi:hypothetical protein